ncbi:MAG: hypothetical protein MUE44_26440 [Oscillatoriaceae cyanobacterium Prado104]|nr:hypothetical protein [Oscillatoriaceae cyanobacterium Prado104]
MNYPYELSQKSEGRRKKEEGRRKNFTHSQIPIDNQQFKSQIFNSQSKIQNLLKLLDS